MLSWLLSMQTDLFWDVYICFNVTTSRLFQCLHHSLHRTLQQTIIIIKLSNFLLSSTFFHQQPLWEFLILFRWNSRDSKFAKIARTCCTIIVQPYEGLLSCQICFKFWNSTVAVSNDPNICITLRGLTLPIVSANTGWAHGWSHPSMPLVRHPFSALFSCFQPFLKTFISFLYTQTYRSSLDTLMTYSKLKFSIPITVLSGNTSLLVSDIKFSRHKPLYWYRSTITSRPEGVCPRRWPMEVDTEQTTRLF